MPVVSGVGPEAQLNPALCLLEFYSSSVLFQLQQRKHSVELAGSYCEIINTHLHW